VDDKVSEKREKLHLCLSKRKRNAFVTGGRRPQEEGAKRSQCGHKTAPKIVGGNEL